MERAPPLQGFLQGFAGTVKPYFDVVDRQIQNICDLGIGETFEVF
jgi:hypothetical protein